MAQESNESISYLLALKQSLASETAASAPATKTDSSSPGDSNATPGEQFQDAEKRRSPRYKCEGSAEMREDGRDVRTWAAFTDISLHGCYLEAQATYPSGTVLHMKLEANDIVVETKGNVRVSYPYLGMGIAFEGISEENQARLRRLLATISHPCVIMGPGIASSLPSISNHGETVPLVANPQAAIQDLVEFFESRQMLMREDFLRILRKSQTTETKV
ncbi:MAG: PilZ domain-containing protein [Candidatus Sulfotelmatobacter sp.]